jgi:hypothetical protein
MATSWRRWRYSLATTLAISLPKVLVEEVLPCER